GDKQKAECISAEDVLKFATVNGAKAIGMEGKLGIIKEGALADIILLNLDEPEFYPMNNIISALAYSATGREVETVIIDGNIVMENNKILTMDPQEVYGECEKISERLGMRE
ncbi:MAG: amidohydrolase family protein, partial [Parasporobacterium sp.]|nr:amidohydrolase family protein [Parasporobacterium sp.]